MRLFHCLVLLGALVFSGLALTGGCAAKKEETHIYTDQPPREVEVRERTEIYREE